VVVGKDQAGYVPLLAERLSLHAVLTQPVSARDMAPSLRGTASAA
jgi:hypothetical protein